MVENGLVRAVFALVGVGVLAASGCDCGTDVRSEPWRFDAGDGADVEIEDREGRDTGEGPYDVIQPRDTCRGFASFDVSYFDIAPGSRWAPAVTGRTVLTEREDSSGPLGIETVHPERVRWTEEGVSDRILAAERGRVLAYRGDADEPRAFPDEGRPVVVGRDGGVGPEAFSDRWAGPGYSKIQTGSARLFDGERFAFVLENDPNEAPGWVGYYDGEGVEEIHIEEWASEPVALIPDGFALVGRTGPLSGGGNLEVFAYREGEGVERVTETDPYERDIVSTREAVFWNTESAVYRADPETLESERIHEGVCSPVGAYRDRAVFSCDPTADEDEKRPGLVLGEQMYYFDGNKTHRVPTGGGNVYSARIHGPHVVWAEYEIFGGSPGEPPGEIRYWRVGGVDSMRVDDIGQPCRSCAMMYPDVSLSVGDGVIAWNYAQADEMAPLAGRTNGGMAVVERECP